MSDPYTLTTRGRLGWAAVVVLVPLASAVLTFGLVDDDLVNHQNSDLAQSYTQAGLADLAGLEDGVPAERAPFDIRYGRSEGTTTLVLYGDHSDFAADAELYAVATANLATHFGKVEIRDVADYTPGLIDSFDAAIYVGTDYRTPPTEAFVLDVRRGDTSVMWVSQNIGALAEVDEAVGQRFVDQYGWDPGNLDVIASSDMGIVEYKGASLSRNTLGTRDVSVPRIDEDSDVEVIAVGECAGAARGCATTEGHNIPQAPLVVRSGNLTFVADLPLDFIDDNELYLVYADLYYELLDSTIEPIRQAAVRLEDVGPESDPEDLRAVADFLSSRDVPFQVAVIPIHLDRTPSGNNWYGLSLLDAPEVVEALQYMQERGGTLIQHGTTHQYGYLDNPYSGRSGEDYEFYGYGCSREALPPFEWEECEQDSFVSKMGPVAQDTIADHTARMAHGRQIMVDAGLGEPAIFETPHYTASPNAYSAMADVYDARYEQVEYFSGMLSSPTVHPVKTFAQIFPYSVHDIYGSTVYPENLQNVTEREQNNHAIRTPETLLARAEANLVVRESTASFYFHPFLDIGYLEELVDGITEMGYTFVAVDELR